MRSVRFLLAVTVSLAVLGGAALLAKKKKKSEEEITQVLELPKDPPAAVIAETERIGFRVTPLSNKGLLSQQVRDALRNLLQTARGATVVKLRAFVAGTGDMRRVQAIVSETFTEKRLGIPALSTIQVGALPLEGAQVELEATLVERKAVNPAGLAFISGQQSAGKEPLRPVAPLVKDSLGRIGAAVRAAGSQPADVLRVSCFLTTLEDVADVRSLLTAAFPQAAANLVQVVRAPVESLAECEAVARLGQSPAGEVVLMNPPGLPSSPSYSQVALVNAPKLAITGTQLAFRAGDEDIRLAFQRLGKALETVRANLSGVFVSNVYPLSRQVTERIRAMRFEFYDKSKPPASTMLDFEGLPSVDASFAVDVIAVSR